ncbi:hypothetical protein V8F33_013950 [Rhypophila sp. PSN 637]
MGEETNATAARRFAHTPELLLCFADQMPKNKSLLFNLCLVSRTFYNIFKRLLWSDMCQGDFYAKQDSLDSSTESENLTHMRTYDDHMTGIRTTREFHRYMVFSNTPDLELAAFEPAFEELLEMIQRGCPKIRGLHLEMCEYRPEINPSVMDGFNNLTHLVLDDMTIENDRWTWHDQANSLANVLIRSPQMRKFGLRNIGYEEETPYFFVLVSDAFAKSSSSTKLRLNTLLLGSHQYPPPSNSQDDPGRYISQLTDVRYLQHLYLGGACMNLPTYDVSRFSGAFGIDRVNLVLLPSFISPKTTPNLRRLSVDILPQQWLEMINFTQPEFATQLSIHLRLTNDNWRYEHRLAELHSCFIRWVENLQDDPFYERRGWPGAERTWNFRSMILELDWSHGHPKNADHIKDASISRDCLAHMKRTGQDTLKDLTIYLKNDDRHEPPPRPGHWTEDMRRCQSSPPSIDMSPWLSFPGPYWRGCAGCLSSRSVVEKVEHTIMSFFGGLGAGFIKRLYIPLSIRTGLTGNLTEKEIDEWNRRLIHKLAAESCLPGLRYVKLHGPAYEIDRRPGGEIRLLKLGWAEEREIELFRDDVWTPWWS